MLLQLEDELNRAKCILADGDASAFLPGETESASLSFHLSFLSLPRVLGCFVRWKLMRGLHYNWIKKRKKNKWDILLFIHIFLEIYDAGRFLKMFLGPVNVRATRKDVQLKIKEDYNSYRVFCSSLVTFCFLEHSHVSKSSTVLKLAFDHFPNQWNPFHGK